MSEIETTGINVGEKIIPEKVQEIKKKIKAELERRKNNDTNIPVYIEALDINTPIIPENRENNYQNDKLNLIQPKDVLDLYSSAKYIINDTEINTPQQFNLIENLSLLLERINSEIDRPFTDAGNCRVNCAGLCRETCLTECTTGCGNDCKDTCKDSCKGGCKGGCGSGCSGGCSGCTGGCSSSCKGACKDGCGGCGHCGDTCTGSCRGRCEGTCKGDALWDD